MKKTISILILAICSLAGFSQAMIVNGDALITKTVGVTELLVKTTDATSYAQVVVQSNTATCNLSMIVFGTAGGVGTEYDNNTAYLSATADKTGIINEQTNGVIIFATGGYGAANEAMRIHSNGQIMIEANGSTHPLTPSAYLHIAAGASTAGHAPLKITPGTLLTTPEPNSIEYDGTDWWFTNSSGVRKKATLQ